MTVWWLQDCIMFWMLPQSTICDYLCPAQLEPSDPLLPGTQPPTSALRDPGPSTGCPRSTQNSWEKYARLGKMPLFPFLFCLKHLLIYPQGDFPFPCTSPRKCSSTDHICQVAGTDGPQPHGTTRYFLRAPQVALAACCICSILLPLLVVIDNNFQTLCHGKLQTSSWFYFFILYIFITPSNFSWCLVLQLMCHSGGPRVTPCPPLPSATLCRTMSRDSRRKVGNPSHGLIYYLLCCCIPRMMIL